MKTNSITGAFVLNLIVIPSMMAQSPGKPQHAVPAQAPAQGITQSGGAPAGVGVSGHGAAPHEVLFKKVDTDGNGSISSTEFRIAVTTGVIPQAGVGAGAPAKTEAQTGAAAGAADGNENTHTKKPAPRPTPR